MTAHDTPVVLGVDDDEEVLGTYALWLQDDAVLRTAADGPEALEKLDATVDVVLLDRMMSGLAGGDVLEQIRARDGSWRVLMVTAVDPDFDLVEMDFDGYLSKPLTQDQLVEAIATVRAWDAYSQDVQAYVRARSTLATLEASKKARTLDNDERYTKLTETVSRLESTVDCDSETIESLIL